MKNARQSLLIVACTLFSLLITLLATTASILQGGFAQVERKSLEEDVQQSLAAISDQLDQLAELAPEVIAADGAGGLAESSRANLDLQAHMTADGQLLDGWVRDSESLQARPLQEESELLRQLLLKTGSPSVRRGLLLLDGRPLLLVLRQKDSPASDPKTPSVLMLGRFLEGSRLERMTRLIHHTLELSPVNDGMPPDRATALAEIAANPPCFVQPLGANRVAGYTLVRDLFDQPALLLRVEAERTMYQQGRTSMGYFTAVTVIFGAVFGLLAWCWRA